MYYTVCDNLQRVAIKKDGSTNRGYDCWTNSRKRPRQCPQTQLLVASFYIAAAKTSEYHHTNTNTNTNANTNTNLYLYK